MVFQFDVLKTNNSKPPYKGGFFFYSCSNNIRFRKDLKYQSKKRKCYLVVISSDFTRIGAFLNDFLKPFDSYTFLHPLENTYMIS